MLRSTAVSFIRGHVLKPPDGEHCRAGLETDPDSAFQFGGASCSSGTLCSGDVFLRGVDPDGKFNFRNVPVGSHTLTASFMVGTQAYASKTPLELGPEGLENVELRPVGPSTVTARLRLEGTSFP